MLLDAWYSRAPVIRKTGLLPPELVLPGQGVWRLGLSSYIDFNLFTTPKDTDIVFLDTFGYGEAKIGF